MTSQTGPATDGWNLGSDGKPYGSGGVRKWTSRESTASALPGIRFAKEYLRALLKSCLQIRLQRFGASFSRGMVKVCRASCAMPSGLCHASGDLRGDHRARDAAPRTARSGLPAPGRREATRLTTGAYLVMLPHRIGAKNIVGLPSFSISS